MDYQQPENSALMHYQCKECGHVEMLWNSRNAVTPFGISCGLDGCDGMKNHVNWAQDGLFPMLPPQAGRVFVSITHEDARQLAEQQWERFASKGVAPATPGSKEEVLASWSEHIYGDGTRPHVVSRGEYQRRQAEEVE